VLLGGRTAEPSARAVMAPQLAAAWRGARELLVDNALTRLISSTALGAATRNPRRVLACGLVLALAGWALGTQTPVQTDITKLVPQNTSSLQSLKALERASGVGGEIDLMVSSKHLTTPAVINWMSTYEKRVLNHFHYSTTRGCGKAQVCPAFSLPDLFQSQTATPTATTKHSTQKTKSSTHVPSQGEIEELLHVIPPYFSQDVITPDQHTATLAFGIRLMGLSQQERVIGQMRSVLHPPKGVSAQLVGLPVLAAQSGSEVASNSRRMITLLAGLLAVALILLIAFGGDRRRALVPMVPIVLATGWSALVLFVIQVPLNPMSVTLGALVTAISTEFSVLLAERHRQERQAGYDTGEALRRSYSRTGAAIAASGVTAIAGFAILILSDISMLRDFGFVTLIDLSVSLLGVLVVLPSALTLSEGGQLESPSAGMARKPRASPRSPRRARHEPA